MSPSSRVSRSPRIHAYAASFGEDLARDIIVDSTAEGATVLDPFVGAGTTALQSLLLNRNAIGIDVDPIAARISRVLTGRFDLGYLTAAMEVFLTGLKEAEEWLIRNPSSHEKLVPGSALETDSRRFDIPSEPAIGFWFDTTHMAVLGVARKLAAEEPDDLVRQFFEVSLSSAIIRKWPNTLSFAMDIDHSRPHRPRVREAQALEKQFALLRRVLTGAHKTVAGLQGELAQRDVSAVIYEGDAVEALVKLPPEGVDFVLTSPPYLNAIDYPRAHKFSQWWLSPSHAPVSRSEYLGLRRGEVGMDVEEWSSVPGLLECVIPFSESKRYGQMIRYVADLSAVLDGVCRVVRPGSPVVFIVADNVVEGKVFPVSAIVEVLFSSSGLTRVATQRRAIERTRRRYPFGVNGFESTMRSEYLVTGYR